MYMHDKLPAYNVQPPTTLTKACFQPLSQPLSVPRRCLLLSLLPDLPAQPCPSDLSELAGGEQKHCEVAGCVPARPPSCR